MDSSAQDFNIRIGNKLREIRELRHISRETIADVLDISSSQVGKIEQGTSGLSARQLFILCYYYQIAPQQLLQTMQVEHTLKHIRENDPHKYRENYLLDQHLQAEIDKLNSANKEHLLALLKGLSRPFDKLLP